MTDRRKEIEDVAVENRDKWLATEIDDLQGKFTEAVTANTTEVKSFKTDIMGEVKGLKNVLTGLLIAIIVSLVSIAAGAMLLH